MEARRCCQGNQGEPTEGLAVRLKQGALDRRLLNWPSQSWTLWLSSEEL